MSSETDDITTYYDVLEIPESASAPEIKAAYLRLAKEYHPDRLGEFTGKLRVHAEEKFKELQEGYDVLREPARRREYDEALRLHRRSRVTTAPHSPTPRDFSRSPDSDASSPASARPNALSSARAAGIWMLFLIGATAVFGLVEFALRPGAQSAAASSTVQPVAPNSGGPATQESSRASSDTDTRSAVARAPDELIDREFCSNGTCQYGERWLARQDMHAYSGPPNAIGVPLTSLQQKTVIPRGVWVTTVTSLVIARRHSGRVDLANQRTSYANGVTNAPPLVNGQTIAIYAYLGEDCFSSWIAGKSYAVCGLQDAGQAAQEWWVEVATSDGTRAWVGPDGGGVFVSQEGLNGELGQAIADPTTGRQAKLQKVDALIREGADLNQGAGRHDISPLEGAVGSLDVELLKALIARGLDVRTSCPAATATNYALKPGGVVMLEALFANGMQLACLQRPALHAFLQFGIGVDPYPVDQAVKVAELLVKHGAVVTARDYEQKTIFDVLDDPRWAGRVAKLKQALLAMANRKGPDGGLLR